MSAIPNEKPQQYNQEAKWAAIAFFVLTIGALGAGGYFGGLAWHNGMNLLHSTAFKVAATAAASTLALGIVFTAINRTKSVGGDLVNGLLKSRIFRAFVCGGLAVGGLFAIMHFGFALRPAPWMIAAAAVGGIGLGTLLQLPRKGMQKIRFEISALLRLPRKNYSEIGVYGYHDKKIFLGALPNRLTGDGRKLVNAEDVNTVFGVIEEWEGTPQGVSIPHDRDDWSKLGVVYGEMNVNDHTLLSDEQLDAAADFIHDQLERDRNVYVHCRAGCGRSAMAVAAYLIKHAGMTAADACNHIEKQRPVSTIQKKLARLQEYETYCQNN